MNIIIVSCVAPPETIVAGRVNYDIAVHQILLGNDVILISPKPSRPIGIFNKITAFDKITKEGFRHIYIDSFIYPKKGFWGRTLESISFGYKSAKIINDYNLKADIIYCMPWPFLGQYLFLKKLKKKATKIIMNVQDLYPESFIDKFKNRKIRSILNLLKNIDKKIAKKSDHLTVVSKSIRDIYLNHRGIDKDKISIIENWQDEIPFIIGSKLSKKQILEKYGLIGIDNKFIFLYFGNIGPVAGLEEMISDLALNNLNPNFVILIAGSGTSKEKCELLVKKHQLENIFFVNPGIGIESVVELQSISNVLLLPIKKGLAQSSIPSKLIAYMFSAKPILSSADLDSFTANAILDSNSGWVILETEKWHSKMNGISIIDKSYLLQLGQNARNYSLENYSKSIGLQKINSLFNKI
jgi:glycosyltransferase involved in cell wall biosynthesis